MENTYMTTITGVDIYLEKEYNLYLLDSCKNIIQQDGVTIVHFIDVQNGYVSYKEKLDNSYDFANVSPRNIIVKEIE